MGLRRCQHACPALVDVIEILRDNPRPAYDVPRFGLNIPKELV